MQPLVYHAVVGYTPEMTTVSSRLKAIRADRQITQQYVGKLINAEARIVADWEGEHRRLGGRRALELGRLLKLENPLELLILVLNEQLQERGIKACVTQMEPITESADPEH